jgi:hypothetical protein
LSDSLDAGWLVVPTAATKNAAALDRLLIRVAKHLAHTELIAHASLDEGRAFYVRILCPDLTEYARLASLSGAQAGLLRVAGKRGGALLYRDGDRGTVVRGTPEEAATLLAEIGAGTVEQVLAAIAVHASVSRPIQHTEQKSSAANPNIEWSRSIDTELETEIAADQIGALGPDLAERFATWQARREHRRALDERGGVDRQTKMAADAQVKAAHVDVFAVVRRVGFLAQAVAMEGLLRVLRARGIDPKDLEAFVKADGKVTR